MKLSIGLLLTAISASMASSSVGPITADSKMGLKLLKHARQLEEGDGENDAQDYYQQDTTWMEDYSLKFIGCHQVAQWNENADEEEDAVRIQTQRYVRFRLCQSQHCVADRAVGCSSSYGDYVVDMDTFVAAHLENQQDMLESNCETQAETCSCDERRLEEGDQENCLSNCYYDAGMSQCVDGQNDLEFLEKYATCTAYENEGNDRRRKLNDAEGDEAEEEYYIGPYCADQGGEVVLGMFTEDSCTTFADNYGGNKAYEEMTGNSLPYSSKSLIDSECRSCLKTSYYQDDNEEGTVREVCEDVYQYAGKCEHRLYNVLENPNDNACNWIHGIRILPITSNGVIHAHYHGTLKAAIAIAFFSLLFVLFAFYVYFLKQKVATMTAAASAVAQKNRNVQLSQPYKKKRRLSFGWISRVFKRKKDKGEALL